jgi:MOB kinase activator 1
MAQNESAHQSNQVATARKSPLFFREENAGFIARGNFMTLALKPQLVEEGEWLAHQGENLANPPPICITLIPLSV